MITVLLKVTMWRFQQKRIGAFYFSISHAYLDEKKKAVSGKEVDDSGKNAAHS